MPAKQRNRGQFGKQWGFFAGGTTIGFSPKGYPVRSAGSRTFLLAGAMNQARPGLECRRPGMKILTTFALCCVTILGVLALRPASAQEPFQLIPGARFLVGIERSMLSVSGETLIPAGGRPGTGSRVDIVLGLGVDTGEATTVRVQSQFLDNHFVDFGYLLAMPTGIKKIPYSFKFQNKTYPSGSTLETRIDFNWVHTSYAYRLFDLASFWAGPRVGAHYVVCAATINGESEEAGIISNTRRLDGIFPVLGFEARYLFPYGVDFSATLEGIHLITKGYLAAFNTGVAWEAYPNVVFTAGASSRFVQYIEDNQPLNNEWAYGLSGLYLGVLFSF